MRRKPWCESLWLALSAQGHANRGCKKITQFSPITPVERAVRQPRAEGALGFSTKQSHAKTVLDGLRQAGSSKLLFPRVSGDGLEAVILNTAGGVTGGDRFSTSVHVGQGGRVKVTTQACERIYRAQPDQVGQVRSHLRVDRGARLDWVPQETILFDGCALDRRLQIDLARDAALLMVEPMIFGRAAMGEALNDIRLRDRIEIRRDGAPIYLDAMRVTGDAKAHFAQPHIAAGAGAMAALVYVNHDAEAHLDPIRALLPETAGASLLQSDVLVLRLLAADSFVLRQTLVPVLNRLSGGALPRCWMI